MSKLGEGARLFLIPFKKEHFTSPISRFRIQSPYPHPPH